MPNPHHKKDQHMTAPEEELMTVGAFARRVGVTVRTVQYYDQCGLLHPTSKSSQNQRLYSPDDEERLYHILTLKYLGLSLTQIKEGGVPTTTKAFPMRSITA